MDVAIVGLTDDVSKATTHFSNTQDIEFHGQWEACQDVVAQTDAESLSPCLFQACPPYSGHACFL